MQHAFAQIHHAFRRLYRNFDVPVLGLRTIQKMGEAKSAALAFPGHKALFFDREESVELAQSHGITIIAFDAPSSP